MLSKPQLVIWPVTSVRQNSAALAPGAIIAPRAIAATHAAAGAVAAFKNSLIMFFLVSALAHAAEVGISGIDTPWLSIKHQSFLKYDNHMMIYAVTCRVLIGDHPAA
jgi:hypothetical protein